MLSNASKYAIRAALYLAGRQGDKTKYSAAEIANKIDVPAPFIAKLLQKMAKNNIISSSKGPTGGFFFSKTNEKKQVYDIIQLIEGRELFNSCFMGLAECTDNKPCPIHHLVEPFRKEIQEHFIKKSLPELSKEIQRKGLFLTLLT